MSARNTLLATLFLAFGLATTVHAATPEGFSIEVGHGDDDVTLTRVGLSWPLHRWPINTRWAYDSFLSSSLAYWRSTRNGNDDLWDIGLTATFRLRHTPGDGVRPYLEGGIGAHLLSRTHLNAPHDYGSALQFGSLLGVGAAFGPRDRFSLGYRLYHISNADLNRANDALNLHEIRLDYRF